MKKRPASQLTALLLIICFLLSLPVRADSPQQYSRMQIRVPFASLGGKVCQWDFPYSDELFRLPSYEFSEDLVKATFGLTVSAFHDRTEKVPLQYETYLKAAGFRDIHAFGYEQETSKDSLAGVIGWKRIDDFIVIAASPRGWGYQKEWGGNLELGTGERHQGFDHAAKIMEAEIDAYLKEHQLEGKLKLWLGGFSRAAAVSNLTAADMIDSGRFEAVYAYLFGVPRTTKDPDSFMYDGIFNICGQNDPVPQVAPQEWGFRRYGFDCYTPSMEADSSYLALAKEANEVQKQLTGETFRYNPEISYQLHMILEFLIELFPTGEEYVEKFQDTLMKVWTEVNPDRFLTILAEAVAQVQDLDRREEKSSEILIDYLSLIMSQHLSEERGQIRDGYWDPDQGLGENLMREHLPYTYLNWIFSDLPTGKLYNGLEFTRRLCIFGEVDVAVYSDGRYIAGRERNLLHTEDPFDFRREDTADPDPIHIYMSQSDKETVINLPMDHDFSVMIYAPKTVNLMYYDVICGPSHSFGATDTMFVQSIRQGEYWLNFTGLPILPPLHTVSGRIRNQREIEFNYSPTLLLANEVQDKHYIRLSDIFQILFYSAIFVALVLLASLIIRLIHRKKARNEDRTFSPWWVIVPHLLLVSNFSVLTRFFTVSMFSIGHVRMGYAILTMLTLALLALRGYLYRRSKGALLITVFMVLIGAADVIFYQRSSFISSSTDHTVFYLLFVMVLSAAAVCTFYIGRNRKSAAA